MINTLTHGLTRQVKPKRRVSKAAADQPVTQEQMLLEAAFTEIHNERSLAVLLAREEAAKARSSLKAEPYSGPLIRYRSRCKEGAEEVRAGCEPTRILTGLRDKDGLGRAAP